MENTETLTENSLVIYLDNNKVEPETKNSLLQSFESFFNQTQEWKEKAEGLVITSADQKEEIKQASVARKALKDIRVSTEHKRKELKEESLRKGQTIDAIAKIITNQILPIEEHLEKQEKFVEIQEAKRKAELKESREIVLAKYDVEGQFYDLGNMPEESFNGLLENSRLAYEAKIQAAAKAESEMIAAEKAEAEARAEQARIEAEERERIRIENEKLKKEAEEKERQEAERVDRQNKLHRLGLRFDGEQFVYKDINFHWVEISTMSGPAFAKALAGAESRMAEIRQEEQAELAAIELQNKAKQEELDKAKAEKERLENELKAKQEAEARKILEEQERAEAELSKGDKDKFLSLIADIEALKTKYSFKSKKHNALQASVNELLTKTITYANSKV